MSGNYNEGREAHEASYYERFDDHDELDPSDCDDDTPQPSPYRCTDRTCGATDCSNCYPGRDNEEPEE